MAMGRNRARGRNKGYDMPMDILVQHRNEDEDEARRYWAQFDADYAALRADPVANAEERQEHALWDTTLMDGLAEYPYDDERLTLQTVHQSGVTPHPRMRGA